MDAVVKKSGFQGSFPAFLEFLRTDPRFYAKTPDELIRQASWIAKRMDGKLPSLFGTLPRQPYGVEPVPDDLAPKYTGGRYVGARSTAGAPGTYWVNTYALETRPFYQLESLTLHEAVPGHHLQIALTKELDGIPPFRRYSYVNAFGEGWGLYSERLGIEAGFYQDPYSDFGRLSYEMWRACRLVVDTGIHTMGWTRQQAIDYMSERHRALEARGHERDRPLHLLARPGARLQDGRAQDPRAARTRREAARHGLRRARVPRRGARVRLGAARRAREADRRVHRARRQAVTW